MPTIEQAINEATLALEHIDKAREQAIATSRALIRHSAHTIRAVHRNDFDQARSLLEEAVVTVAQLSQRLSDLPNIFSAGYTQDALKEYVEAQLVYAFVYGTQPPSAEELKVPPAAYLNGMAEAASELRRYILDSLRRGTTERCEPLLSIMDEIYSLLITVDFADAVTGGLRRTTDALRGVLERTRGDMTAALRQEQLSAALALFESRLGLSSTSDAQPLAPEMQE